VRLRYAQFVKEEQAAELHEARPLRERRDTRQDTENEVETKGDGQADLHSQSRAARGERHQLQQQLTGKQGINA
jgi:hypothetical protein